MYWPRYCSLWSIRQSQSSFEIFSHNEWCLMSYGLFSITFIKMNTIKNMGSNFQHPCTCARGHSRLSSLNQNEPGDAIETTRQLFDNEKFWTWACYQLIPGPITSQQISIKNMSPQWVVYLNLRYSHVTLVNWYLFWQRPIDQNMDDPLSS